MPKDPSPLLGYNNNIKHKNRVFHVQTEDSGVRHPHIITHLFMDGGRILKSMKRSYAEYIGVDKMSDVVRQLMKDQHKGMLIALRDGQFDQLLEDADSGRPGARPVEVVPNVTQPMLKAAAAPTPSRPALRPPAMPEAAKRASSRPPAALALPEDEGPPTTRMPLSETDVGSSLDADVDAMEDLEVDIAPAFEPESDLPPPPANMFRPKEAGSPGTYRALTPPPDPEPITGSRPPPSSKKAPSRSPRPRTPVPVRAEPSTARSPSNRSPANRADPRVERSGSRPPLAKPPSAPAGRPLSPPRPASQRPASLGGPGSLGHPQSPGLLGGHAQTPGSYLGETPKTPGDARYAPARPAAIFGQGSPKRGASIFGEDLISDKSLDEVILSYLAEDLETAPADPKKKKK
jgi:hypothetical protein